MSEQIRQALEEEIKALKSPKGYLYAGLPKFKGLFGRDSLISAWQMLSIDPEIAKATLRNLAKIQGKKTDTSTLEEAGKIPHEYYPATTDSKYWTKNKAQVDWLKKGEPVYFSIDATPLFIILFFKYFEKEPDFFLLKETWNSLKAAGNWIVLKVRKDGFLTHPILDPKKGLNSQSWKDGIGKPLEGLRGNLAVVEVQGYAYEAMKHLSLLARLLSEKKFADILDEEAENLKNRFEKYFWFSGERYYCFALLEDGKALRCVTSNPGHLLFTRLISPAKKKEIVRRLFASDMWTPYGIRTLSTQDRYFDPFAYQLGAIWPHDNWIIAEGMRESGFGQAAEAVKKSILDAYTELGKMPEFFGVDKENRIITKGMKDRACYPQAWSSCAVYNIVMSEEKVAI